MAMSTFAKDQATVKALAKRISTIEPRDVSGIALVGLMTGVLYSLERSIELRFDDARTKKREINEEKIEIRSTLEAIRHDCPPPDAWLAGFYLDSAIMRLDTFYQRIDHYAHVKCILANEVNRTNRAIKHEIDAGLGKGWRIRFEDVLRSTKDVCELLEKILTQNKLS